MDAIIDPTDATRITLNDGTVARMYAPEVYLAWDPVTSAIRGEFMMQMYVSVGGTVVPVASGSSLGMARLTMAPSISEVLGASYGALADPVTGVDISNVSVAGTLALLQRACTTGYNAQWPVHQMRQQTDRLLGLLAGARRSADNGSTTLQLAVEVVGRTVTVTPTITPSAGATVTSYGWMFGDGDSSIESTPPPHTYAAPGTYGIIGIVGDSTGAYVRMETGVQIVA